MNDLRDWVRADFGISLGPLTRTADGADEHAELWRGVAGDQHYAVKLSSGGSPAGLVVAARLAESGVPGVPAPVRTRGGALWSERAGRRLSVLPWVSDHRALSGGMTAAHWATYGELLRQVHSTPIAGADLPREDHDHDHDRIASVARSLRVAGDDPLVRAMAALWPAAETQVAALLDQADRLGGLLRHRAAPDVVCHADPHLGNLLLGPAGRVWLIDWDDAVLAPPERDLLFVLGGVLAFAPVTPEQTVWFFDGYGSVEIDPLRLSYYRTVRALEDLVGPAAQIVDVEQWSEPERTDALDIVRGVLSPTGLVRLALEPHGVARPGVLPEQPVELRDRAGPVLGDPAGGGEGGR